MMECLENNLELKFQISVLTCCKRISILTRFTVWGPFYCINYKIQRHENEKIQEEICNNFTYLFNIIKLTVDSVNVFERSYRRKLHNWHLFIIYVQILDNLKKTVKNLIWPPLDSFN